jgi:hypothetical protein
MMRNCDELPLKSLLRSALVVGSVSLSTQPIKSTGISPQLLKDRHYTQNPLGKAEGSVNYASRLCFFGVGARGRAPKAYGPSGTRVLPVRAGVGSFRIYCS